MSPKTPNQPRGKSDQHRSGGKLLLPFCFLSLALLPPGCSRQTESAGPAAEAKGKLEPESRVHRGTNGEVLIKLDVQTQKLMGLETAALTPLSLKPEVKAYGRVLDTTPLALLVTDLATAQAASEASQAELKRLKTLAAQNNASERALQAAAAAATRDQAQVQSARTRLLLNWGSGIAARPDLPAFVQSLSSLDTALVELDLPAGQSVAALPLRARLLTLADETKPIAAQFLSPAPTTDPQLQGRGFLFLVTPNSSRLTPGATVSGFLALPGDEQAGVELPRSAVLRFNGQAWVYRQTGEETFERIEVTLDRPLDNGWFVREGLKPQDKVVIVGAQQLLSEELKGQAEE